MVKLKLCAPTERYRKRGPDIVEMLIFFDFVFQSITCFRLDCWFYVVS